MTNELHLVTGGAGYFGSLLASRLHRDGHAVRIFDIAPAVDLPAEIEIIRGDIRDRDAVRRACEGVSVVQHNVAMVPLAKDRAAFWSVNRDGTENMLRAALDAGVGKVIHMSSSAVFGTPPRNPVDDSVHPRPREAYGEAKLAGEKLVGEYVRRGLDVTIIRPRTIMGHGRLGIMQILFEWIRRGSNVPVLGRGDNKYQFVHADDLASACVLAAARKGPSVYNIGAAEFGTMRETLAGLIAHAGTGSRIVSLPAGLAVKMMEVTSTLGLSPLGAYHSLMYGKEMYFDLAKPQRELGWKPVFGNVEMFCDSYDWYLAHREEVLAQKDASHHRSPVRQGILRWVEVLARVMPAA